MLERVQIPDPTDYGISYQYGFLPSEPPIRRLSGRYYSPWEDLVSNLPDLLKTDGLRARIEKLPVLSTAYLQKHPEWMRAYVCLVFLTNGFVWGGRTPETTLPPCITVPLLEICSFLEIPPLATYAGLCLWNYRLRCPEGDANELQNLQCNTLFTGTRDEEWFYMVSVAIEAHGAPAIFILLDAVRATYLGDSQTVTECLISASGTLLQLGDLLDRMYEKCAPLTFYSRLRPFLAGTSKMEEYGLPNGLNYDNGSGNVEFRSYRGGSNAQSSLIQLFDIILGIQHLAGDDCVSRRGEHSPGPASLNFLDEMRAYMPGPHRRFLEAVSRIAGVREFVVGRNTDVKLQSAYSSCITALYQLRDRHIRMVSRYIIVPSRKMACSVLSAEPGQTRSGSRQISPQMSKALSSQPDHGPRGTGGTDLIPFLKRTRDETCEPMLDILVPRC